ncbi:hypothetical protein ACIP79_11940 [Streptomyces sp. NPDC088747]|uniref:hypothetical protein n=1 Tax=Streptomyces sp. NPDC088747 TaxID=3365886 RepID=UPI00382EA2B2
MSALFRIRVLATSGTRIWCAAAGRLTVRTSRALHDELTDRCAGASVVVLDLREIQLPADGDLLAPPWPDGPRAVHLLAPTSLRGRTAVDVRVHWHADVDTAWSAWCAPPAAQPGK